MGNLPFDKPPSEKDRKILVDALIEAFPVAAKGMATVSRVCKQQVKQLNSTRPMRTKNAKFKTKYSNRSSARYCAEFEPYSHACPCAHDGI